MAEITQYICDNPNCKAVKKSENHWWTTDLKHIGRTPGVVYLRLVGMPHAPAKTPGELRLIFCGEKCVLWAVSQWMSGKLTIGEPACQKLNGQG